MSRSFALDGNRLLSGLTLSEAIEAVDERAGDARPDFYGINCSHPVEFGPALEPGDPGEPGREMGELAGRYPQPLRLGELLRDV